MGRLIDAEQALRIDMRVILCRGEARMAQEFLHAAKVRAVVEKVGGKAVPELVGADVEGDVRVLQVFLDQRPDAAG